jgi:hypothetical protein
MAWTDPILNVDIGIKRIHIHELREKLDAKNDISCPTYCESLHTSEQNSNYPSYNNNNDITIDAIKYGTDDNTKYNTDNAAQYMAENSDKCPSHCPAYEGAVRNDYGVVAYVDHESALYTDRNVNVNESNACTWY